MNKQKAPIGVSVKNETGKNVRLKNFLGKYVVIYFSPYLSFADSLKVVKNFEKTIKKLREYDVEVVGVSKLKASDLTKLKNEYPWDLHLWSDPDSKLIKAFGVWIDKQYCDQVSDGSINITFIINPEGKIAETYENVPLSERGKMSLDFFEKLNSED